MDRVKDHVRKVRVGHELYENDQHKIELQSRNGVLQFNEVIRLIDVSDGELRLTRRKILRLHHFAIQDIYECAGRFRKWPVVIRGSLHRPPESRYVKSLVAEMCATANTSTDWSPTKTAAFLIWRLNWIHPFGGGNGRTSRALAYYSLCVHLKLKLPGKFTIAEQIDRDRRRYQVALEDADAAWREHSLDVSQMESLVEDFLERQLAYLDEPQADTL
jgi:Fic family protein